MFDLIQIRLMFFKRLRSLANMFAEFSFEFYFLLQVWLLHRLLVEGEVSLILF